MYVALSDYEKETNSSFDRAADSASIFTYWRMHGWNGIVQPFWALLILVLVREPSWPSPAESRMQRNQNWKEDRRMKLARIIAPFSLSAVLFVLSYLSVKDINSGFYSILLLVIGIALAIVGSAAVFSDK